jgi:ribonuclease HII
MGRRWSTLERELREAYGPHLAGVDEVGRGPLAGPVVACAVIMPADARVIPGIDDSKALDKKERDRLARLIHRRALATSVAAASVREIDRLNIYHATSLAIRRALDRLRVRPDHVVLDGKAIRALPYEHTAVVGGDAACYSVACASILAKVTRDRVMHSLARRYPGYGWESNVGYGTRTHLDGLRGLGTTRHHRRSFMPVQQLAFDLMSIEAPVPDAPALLEADEAVRLAEDVFCETPAHAWQPPATGE